jgi:hypothetical protein
VIRVLCLLCLAVTANGQFPNRWVFVTRNLSSDAHVEDIRRIARTASQHGLTGMMLSASFDNLDRQSDAYRQRLAEVRRIADENALEIIPLFFSPGYAGGILAHDRNLAEGLPVNGVVYEVSGNEARHVPDPEVALWNNSFEDYAGNRITGYQLQDRPGELSFVDAESVQDGAVSLRFENLESAAFGNARIMQEIAVQPNRCYRVSAWVKSEGLQPASAFRLQVLGLDGRALAPWTANLPSSTDWRKLTFGFNSMDRTRVRLYAGTWGGRAGKFWIDNWRVEEVGLLNVLRRDGTPVRVEGESESVYEEGIDYQPIADPMLNFRFDHDGPPIRLLPNTRITSGERLRVSYYHGVSVNDGQVAACMSEPAVLEIVARNARLIHEYLAPRKYILSIDEIRAAGSCDACKRRGLTLAQILGDFVTRGLEIVREINPEAEVFAWSDMLDPNHNARPDYYLAGGDYTGSWDYVPRDLNIVCWYHSRRKESLKHFSSLGFRTLAAAYYDADDLDSTKGWLEALKETEGATGIMYTTWENKYGLLPDFGDLVSLPW